VVVVVEGGQSRKQSNSQSAGFSKNSQIAFAHIRLATSGIRNFISIYCNTHAFKHNTIFLDSHITHTRKWFSISGLIEKELFSLHQSPRRCCRGGRWGGGGGGKVFHNRRNAAGEKDCPALPPIKASTYM
jgi:hypothetical protein